MIRPFVERSNGRYRFHRAVVDMEIQLDGVRRFRKWHASGVGRRELQTTCPAGRTYSAFLILSISA